MSALSPKADIRRDDCDVRFVPKADIRSAGFHPSDGGHHLRPQQDKPPRLSNSEAHASICEGRTVRAGNRESGSAAVWRH